METLREALDGLCAPFPDAILPRLDRANVDDRTLTAQQRHWRDHGFVILPRFLPDELLDAYAAAWLRDHAEAIWVAEDILPVSYTTLDPHGYPDATPYMRVPELRTLTCDQRLAHVLEHLIGEPMGVHLNLTGWESTQRDWHQDGYLNPDPTADWYAAVWVALADIDETAGPFEYVPGSHRWPTIRQTLMLEAMGEPPNGLDGQWPKRSEQILTPIFEQHLRDYGITPRRFVARKGDVLVWHARLLHRGSPPQDPTLERRAVIAHYSGVTHRPDMPPPTRDPAGGWFFPLRTNVTV